MASLIFLAALRSRSHFEPSALALVPWWRQDSPAHWTPLCPKGLWSELPIGVTGHHRPSAEEFTGLEQEAAESSADSPEGGGPSGPGKIPEEVTFERPHMGHPRGHEESPRELDGRQQTPTQRETEPVSQGQQVRGAGAQAGQRVRARPEGQSRDTTQGAGAAARGQMSGPGPPAATTSQTERPSEDGDPGLRWGVFAG